MFFDKAGPKDWVFPACCDCNNGSSNDDRIFSVFAIMFCMKDADELSQKDIKRTIRSVSNGVPSDFRNRVEQFLSREDIPFEDYPSFDLLDSDKKICHLVARKIAKAIYYKKHKKSLPKAATLSVHWIVNVDWNEKTIGPLSQFIPETPAPTIKDEDSVSDGEQFIYSINNVEEYIFIFFKIHMCAIYCCLISPSGAVRSANPAFSDWYDMKDNKVSQEPA